VNQRQSPKRGLKSLMFLTSQTTYQSDQRASGL